jgi:hypothetical protein
MLVFHLAQVSRSCVSRGGVIHSSHLFLQLGVVMAIIGTSWGATCDQPIAPYLVLYGMGLLMKMGILYGRYRDGDARPAEGRLINRASTVVDIYTVMVFIFGSYTLMASSVCHATAPGIYYTAVVMVILGYVSLAIPTMVCAGLICCLPCIPSNEAAQRGAGWSSGGSGDPQREADIVKCVTQYRISLEPGPKVEASGLEEESGMPHILRRPGEVMSEGRSSWATWWRGKGGPALPQGRGTSASGPSAHEDLPDLPGCRGDECVVCLEEYASGEAVGMLRCGHYFHANCVSRWLRRSVQCPLCKQAMRTTTLERMGTLSLFEGEDGSPRDHP